MVPHLRQTVLMISVAAAGVYVLALVKEKEKKRYISQSSILGMLSIYMLLALDLRVHAFKPSDHV